MKTRAISMREKIIASAASAALAASMVVCVPGMAFASYDKGSITPSSTSLSVVAGSQTDLSKLFTYKTEGGDGVCHIDYKVTGGSGATVNKHSGVLTANSVGDVVVTAYLTGVAQPQGVKDNPCDSTEAKASSSINIKITESSTYGWQGIGGNSIKITSPEVTSVGGSDTEGWTNYLAASSPVDGYYDFTISMNNGFKSYDGADEFAALNAGNVTLKKTDGTLISTLSASNDGGVVISEANSTNKTVTVSVSQELVSSGNVQLVFGAGFRGNNASNVLGTTVAFVIK